MSIVDDTSMVDDTPGQEMTEQTTGDAAASSDSKTIPDNKNSGTSVCPPDDPPPKPMSEEDVLEVMAKMAKLDAKEISVICDGYANKLKSMIVYIKNKLHVRKDEDELVELDRILRLINMCPKDELFIRSKDKIWHARYHIIHRDSQWFLNRDYSASIKKDNKQRMIETLIRMIQAKWKKMSEDERELYWQLAFEILNLVANFKKLTDEH